LLVLPDAPPLVPAAMGYQRLTGSQKLGFLSLAVLAFACTPRSQAADARKPAPPAQSAAPRLESALDVDATNGVKLTFHVVNAGGADAELDFPSSQTHEVVVLDSLGRQVWQWSEGKMFTQVMQARTLRASDTMSFDERWVGASRGRYVAVARLTSANYPVESRVAFTVPR